MPKRKNKEGRRVTRLKREAREVIRDVRQQAAQEFEEFRNALQVADGIIADYKKKYIVSLVINILLATLLGLGAYYHGV